MLATIYYSLTNLQVHDVHVYRYNVMLLIYISYHTIILVPVGVAKLQYLRTTSHSFSYSISHHKQKCTNRRSPSPTLPRIKEIHRSYLHKVINFNTPRVYEV